MVKVILIVKCRILRSMLDSEALPRPSRIFSMNPLNRDHELKLYSTLQDNKDINEVM